LKQRLLIFRAIARKIAVATAHFSVIFIVPLPVSAKET
jgi:hypothetical protein